MTATAETSAFLAWREALRVVEDACPWPGPRPLRQKDGLRLLVGRERDRKLFNHEVQNHRLILLGGESGVGKSSLLDAGLVPDLESAGYTAVICRNWGADVETDDEAFLAHAVYTALSPSLQKKLTDDKTLFYQLDDLFGDWLVIIFDQFEELLRYNRDRKERITKLLLGIHQACVLRVVLSFRSEYLHELKDIESGATPFGISRYMLDAVEDKYASQVIATTRNEAREAIERTVAAELAERWAKARAHEGGSSVMVTQVGMLHLQAMLYALHDRAGGGTIDNAVLASMRNDASGHGTSDAALFAFGLQEAVSVKLRRCEAAAVDLGMDDFLIRGASTVLSKTVGHLSSGGYKLVREAYDLAATVMGNEIEACVEALRDGEAFEGDARRETTAPLRRMLSAIAEDALREVEDQPSTGPTDGQATVSQSDIGLSMNAPRSKLADKADLTSQTGELSWSGLLERGHGAQAANNPAAGPMRGLPPAHVLIEELRRFAWALVWLKESNLVRITRHGQQSMVSLIHDGFGEALLQWAESYAMRDRAWALYALTAPSGAPHLWLEERAWADKDGKQVTIQSELSGSAQTPKVLANLCFKGNSIMLARFVNTVFVNCDFRGILFLKCSFEGTTFVNCQLDGALFSDCTVTGRPDPAEDQPEEDELEDLVPADPTFNIPGAEPLARIFRHYRDDGAATDSHLISREAGKPADAVDERLRQSDRWLPWTPARAGLVAYGSRISALTFRGTMFESEGTVSFRGVTGSGLDLAELSGANLEFHRCLLRHVAFTSGPSAKSAELHVRITYSVLAQWWFGQGFKGSLHARGSRLAQVWNDSSQLLASLEANRTLGLVGPADRDTPGEVLRAVIGRTDYRRS